jgi:hypothetical protein
MLVETQYFPSIKFWAKALKTGSVKLEKYENYQKRSYRNKCLILAANGVLPLTVPLKSGKNNKMPISDVLISYDDHWQKKHLTTISSAYTSSPYYEFYIDEISDILLKNYKNLFDLNYSIIEWFCEQFNIPLSNSIEYIKAEKDDCRQAILPKNREMSYAPYIQVFTEKYEFQSDLSILDLLFCKGPEMKSYLLKL